MSSTQEPHLLPPPKPKLSPLDLRNTDLVSRLLAATPPYLYNMSLLPNTYFFSEMLRSFVQAKNEQNAQRGNIGGGFGNNANMYYGHTIRRSRKRGWNNVGREILQNNAPMEEKIEKTSEKIETNEPWMIKSMRKNEDNALELTTNGENIHQKIEDHQRQKTPKLEDQPLSFTTQQENSTNLVLPPPPPIWYPPIYPTPPYGIDPLHFFIDLRVSGQIYDKQNNNQKDGSSGSNISAASPAGDNGSNTTIVGPKEQEKIEVEQKQIKIEDPIGDIFRQKRHSSAFSVPNSSSTSKNRLPDKSQTRFDVKSMGFDKDLNKTSTNYIMGNISNIYKNLVDKRPDVSHHIAYSTSKNRSKATDESTTIDRDVQETKDRCERNNDQAATRSTNITSSVTFDQSDEEKQKKAKALRALIGMELVVDYMGHKKEKEVRPNGSYVISDGEDEFGSEVESVGSPQLEVVAIQDDA